MGNTVVNLAVAAVALGAGAAWIGENSADILKFLETAKSESVKVEVAPVEVRVRVETDTQAAEQFARNRSWEVDGRQLRQHDHERKLYGRLRNEADEARRIAEETEQRIAAHRERESRRIWIGPGCSYIVGEQPITIAECRALGAGRQ